MLVRDFNSFGVLGCGELDIVLDQLSVALANAENVGVQTSAAYESARSFYDDNTGINVNLFSFGTDCTNKVETGKSYIAALNPVTVAAGGQATEVPSVSNQGTGVAAATKAAAGAAPNPFADIKWILIAGAVLGVVWVAGPAIKTALGARRKT